MRIMMVCADPGVPLGGNGGSSVHFRAMAGAFTSLGHDVALVVSNATGANVSQGACFTGQSGSQAGGLSFPWSVTTVPCGLAWPAVQNWVESLRGGEQGDGAVASTERGKAHRPSPESSGPIGSCPSAAQAGTGVPAGTQSETGASADNGGVNAHPSDAPLPWRTRLYYETLPRAVYSAEEYFWHHRRMFSAIGDLLQTVKPDMIYERYALCQTGALRASRKAGIPHFLEVNAPLVRERMGDAGAFLRAFAARDERWLWQKTDRAFCVSRAMQGLVASLRDDGEMGALFTPNGVDVRAFSPDRGNGGLHRRLGLEAQHNDVVLLGWLGALSRGRGAEEFVALAGEVLSQVPQAHAVLIGGGSLEAELRERAAALPGGSRIHFLGAVAHHEVPPLLADLNIAVASYPAQRDFYFSPMKLYEYMACGLPVVAGDMGQMREVVEQDVSGVLVPPEAVPTWVEALVNLCRDKEARERLGRGARDRALRFGSWEGNARLVLAKWKTLAGEAV